MKLLKPSLLDVLYIVRHMREADRRELFATRNDDDEDRLAMDVLQRWGPWTWVAGSDELGAVAVFSATKVWPGHWSVGMFATDKFPAIGAAMTRRIKRAIIPAIRAEGIRRAECKSLVDHVDAHAWLEKLGFKRKVLLEEYGKNGEPFYLFTWGD